MDKAPQETATAPSSQEYLEPIMTLLALCGVSSVTESAIIKDLLSHVDDPIKREACEGGLIASTSLPRLIKTLMIYGMLCENVESLINEIPKGSLHTYLTALMQYFDHLIVNDVVKRANFFACVEGEDLPTKWRKSLRNALFHGKILFPSELSDEFHQLELSWQGRVPHLGQIRRLPLHPGFRITNVAESTVVEALPASQADCIELWDVRPHDNVSAVHKWVQIPLPKLSRALQRALKLVLILLMDYDQVFAHAQQRVSGQMNLLESLLQSFKEQDNIIFPIPLDQLEQ